MSPDLALVQLIRHYEVRRTVVRPGCGVWAAAERAHQPSGAESSCMLSAENSAPLSHWRLLAVQRRNSIKFLILARVGPCQGQPSLVPSSSRCVSTVHRMQSHPTWCFRNVKGAGQQSIKRGRVWQDWAERTVILVAEEGVCSGEVVGVQTVALSKLGERHLGRRQQALYLHINTITLPYH